jgi:hypothetical protein
VTLEEAIIEGSWIFQNRLKKVTAESEERGRTAGRVEEARRLLRLILAKKFPGLENHPALDSLSDPEAIESLYLNYAVLSSDRDEVERAIRDAAPAGPHA